MNQKQEPILVSDEEKIVELLIENIDSLEDKILNKKEDAKDIVSEKDTHTYFKIDLNNKLVELYSVKYVLSDGDQFSLRYVFIGKNNKRRYGRICPSAEDIKTCVQKFIQELKDFGKKKDKKIRAVLKELDRDKMQYTCEKKRLSKKEISSEIEKAYTVGEIFQDEHFVFFDKIYSYNFNPFPEKGETIEDKIKRDKEEEIERKYWGIDDKSISYFLERLRESSHPVFKLFYSYVLLDIRISYQKVTFKSDFSFKKIADQYIESIKKVVKEEFYTKEKYYELYLAKFITYGMKIAKMQKDQKSIGTVKDLLFFYLKKHCQDHKRVGVWKPILEEIIGLKAVGKLDNKEERDLLEYMNQKYKDILKDPQRSISFKTICSNFIRFYENPKQIKKIKKYVEIYRKGMYGTAFFVLDESERLKREVYQKHFSANSKMMKNINNQIEEMKKIEHEEAEKNKKRVTHEFKLNENIKKNFLTEIFEGSENNPDIIFEKFAALFLLRPDMIKEVLLESPLNFFIDHKYSEGGKTIKQFSPQDKPDEFLFSHSNFLLAHGSIYIRECIEEIIEQLQFNEDKLTEYFLKSPLFEQERAFILKECFKNYLSFSNKIRECKKQKLAEIEISNEISFVSMVIPEIEYLIIRFLKREDVKINRENQEGGEDSRGIERLLDDDFFYKSQIGSYISFHFRSILTSKASWNLRNRLAHGKLHFSAYRSINVFDYLFHILVCMRCFFKLESKKR